MANEGFGTSWDTRLAQAMYRSTAERGFVPAMVRVVKWIAEPCSQAMMFTPPSTYTVAPDRRRAYGVAR